MLDKKPSGTPLPRLAALAPLILFASQGSPGLPAQSPFADSLKATAFQWVELSDAHGTIFNIGTAGRKQRVTVMKQKDTWMSLKQHKIRSYVWGSATAPSGDFLRKTFQNRFNEGGLQYCPPKGDENTWRIQFQVSVPEDISSTRLAAIIRNVAIVSDQLEKELMATEEDKF